MEHLFATLISGQIYTRQYTGTIISRIRLNETKLSILVEWKEGKEVKEKEMEKMEKERKGSKGRSCLVFI